MHIFIEEICDTAYVKDLNGEEILALCDHINDALTVSPNGVVKLRWTKKTYAKKSRNSVLLLKTKVWVTPLGVRKIRIQCHKFGENGRIGSRVHLEERHLGRIIER